MELGLSFGLSPCILPHRDGMQKARSLGDRIRRCTALRKGGPGLPFRSVVKMMLEDGDGGGGRLLPRLRANASHNGEGDSVDDKGVKTAIGRIEQAEITSEMSTSYMDFALSVIMGRALPDVRDGLKPVHRRILYAMYDMNMRPEGPYRKCARVVGEVLGKFHPHGDASVYDALVRMAQGFSMNIPLVDGHGNFGSVDGDSAAAMRYTECRLSRLCNDGLLQDIDYETVDFAPNFDGSAQEPLVLPARLPNLLLSGSQGIAVGVATKVPPYNLFELIEALLLLVADPNTPDLDILEVMPAPDFPTGAEIIGLAGSRELFSTGRGKIIMSAKTHFENVRSKRGRDRKAIVVTELPYQVNKAMLVKTIADQVNANEISGIVDLRDESDREGMRIVIEVSKQAHPEVVLRNLFRTTRLRTTFGAHIVALDGGKLPERLTVRQCLTKFLDFRREVVRKRCEFELGKAAGKFHLIEGYIIALRDIDLTIRTIKGSVDSKSALAVLIDPNGSFGLSKEQADAVMSMQLRKLTRMEMDALQKEHEQLRKEILDLKNVLDQPSRISKIIRQELLEVRAAAGTKFTRRSAIVAEPEDAQNDLELIPNGRSVILLTSQGYIKRMPIENFNIQKRGGRGSFGVRNMREEDRVEHFFTCRDHDTVLVITKDGIAYRLAAHMVPVSARSSRGAPIEKLIPTIGSSSVAMVLNVSEFPEDRYLISISKLGMLKKTPMSCFAKMKNQGLIMMVLRDGDELKTAGICGRSDTIVLCTKKGYAAQTSLDDKEHRPRSRRTRGNVGMRMRQGDEIVDAVIVPNSEGDKVPLLVLLSVGIGKRTLASQIRSTHRGSKGVQLASLRKDESVVAVRQCNDDDQFMVVTSQGHVVRANGGAVRTVGRSARGVSIQRTSDDNEIIAVDLIDRRIREETGEVLSFLNEGIDISDKIKTAAVEAGAENGAQNIVFEHVGSDDAEETVAAEGTFADELSTESVEIRTSFVSEEDDGYTGQLQSYEQ